MSNYNVLLEDILDKLLTVSSEVMLLSAKMCAQPWGWKPEASLADVMEPSNILRTELRGCGASVGWPALQLLSS